ncbi:MAG: gliding motility-associated C-terminal domain-containing protein, partial [Bacteroidia bacterium]|nr:gliding motility-associated C-terminal domain-containing protein [Bacteroidia bacterium]
MNDGFAIVEASGGTQPYTFNWYDEDSILISTGSGITIDSMINMAEGIYIAQVVDDSSCTRIEFIEIIDPDSLMLNILHTAVTCNDTCDGALTALVTGGTVPYIYLWSNGDSDSTITGLCPYDAYNIIVTDAHGCTATGRDSLQAPVQISIIIDSLEGTTCSQNTIDGLIFITTSGGTTPYNFLWSNTMIDEDIDSLNSGWYYLTITDNVNCQFTDSIYVTPGLVVEADAGYDGIICQGEKYQLIGDSNINAYWFTWTPNYAITDTAIYNPVVNPMFDTLYILHVEDIARNCWDEDAVYIEVLPVPVVDAGQDLLIRSNETAYLDATCNEANAHYLWSPSTWLSDIRIEDPTAEPDVTIMYYLTVTAENGCINLDSVLIRVIPALFIPSGFTPNNDGDNDDWDIGYSEFYPDMEVQVFNRWGKELFYERGYTEKWDGTYKGKPLPAGTYYYIIKLNDELNTEPITGPITIIR